MKTYYFNVCEVYDKQNVLIGKTVTVSITPDIKSGKTIDYSTLSQKQKDEVDSAMATISDLIN